MSCSFAALLLLTAAASAQTVAWSPAHGSISGTVTDAGTKAPLAGRTVSVQVANPGGGTLGPVVTSGGVLRPAGFTAQTDIQGHYQVSDLAQASYIVSVIGDDILPARAAVNLAGGEDHTGVDFAVALSADLSGTVMDRLKYPMIRVQVTLLERLYQNGKAVYGQASTATTDNLGNYRLNRSVKPGGVYALLANPVPHSFPTTSDASPDPDKRDKVLAPVYYMNSGFIDGAVTISPLAGQKIEDLDIEMDRVKSYCAQGVTLAEGKAAPTYLGVTPSGSVPVRSPAIAGTFYVVRSQPATMTDSEGQFRICGLPPGEYRLTATATNPSARQSQPQIFGALAVSIADRDLEKLQIDAVPDFPVSGDVVWDGEPPAKQEAVQLHVSLQPALSMAPTVTTAAPLPGHFVANGVLSDEYTIRASVAAGYYIKDIIYGGASVLHQEFKTTPGASLKIVVAGDGSTITAKVADKDGNPVPSATVWFLAANAVTAAELETVLTSVTTNGAGQCVSATLPPGRYTVLATPDPLDRTAANIDRLWSARGKGAEVELGPTGSKQVGLAAITVF